MACDRFLPCCRCAEAEVLTGDLVDRLIAVDCVHSTADHPLQEEGQACGGPSDEQHARHMGIPPDSPPLADDPTRMPRPPPPVPSTNTCLCRLDGPAAPPCRATPPLPETNEEPMRLIERVGCAQRSCGSALRAFTVPASLVALPRAPRCQQSQGGDKEPMIRQAEPLRIYWDKHACANGGGRCRPVCEQGLPHVSAGRRDRVPSCNARAFAQGAGLALHMVTHEIPGRATRLEEAKTTHTCPVGFCPVRHDQTTRHAVALQQQPADSPGRSSDDSE